MFFLSCDINDDVIKCYAFRFEYLQHLVLNAVEIFLWIVRSPQTILIADYDEFEGRVLTEKIEVS